MQAQEGRLRARGLSPSALLHPSCYSCSHSSVTGMPGHASAAAPPQKCRVPILRTVHCELHAAHHLRAHPPPCAPKVSYRLGYEVRVVSSVGVHSVESGDEILVAEEPEGGVPQRVVRLAEEVGWGWGVNQWSGATPPCLLG